MAYQITQQQYRDEWVVAFQRGETYLRQAATPEMVIQGNQALFPIQGASTGATSRGVNGLIPSDNPTDTQVTVVLEEKHRKETQTGFNIFTAHGNLREAMQNRGALALAREVDDKIIADGLESATTQYNGGTAITLTYGRVQDIMSDLLENNVYALDEVCFVWTPKAWARLLTFSEWTSSDYVEDRFLLGGTTQIPRMWNGAMHMVHTGLPSVGAATAKCYAFGKSALGYAMNTDGIDVAIGYDDEDDYSYARHTIFHGAEILQQSGIIEIVHDDTAAIT
ncbi:MAG: phage capsid protein [Myxococcales bacterium]|nr:phage capsid protein [Myxococcales bacterium]